MTPSSTTPLSYNVVNICTHMWHGTGGFDLHTPGCDFLLLASLAGKVLQLSFSSSVKWNNIYLFLLSLVAQLCPTLRDPTDCSPSGSSVHGILQAGILEWVAIPFYRGSFQPRDRAQVSCMASRFFTIWTTRATPILFLQSSKYFTPDKASVKGCYYYYCYLFI